MLAPSLVPLVEGKINLQGSSAAMVVGTVSPASVTWKEYLDGSSAPMVACTVSRASVSREDKPQSFVCCHGCLHRITCVCRKKGNLDGSSAPMVGCTASPAPVSREDKPHSDPPAPVITSTACRDCSVEEGEV